jgi:hypothetical protein
VDDDDPCEIVEDDPVDEELAVVTPELVLEVVVFCTVSKTAAAATAIIMTTTITAMMTVRPIAFFDLIFARFILL